MKTFAFIILITFWFVPFLAVGLFFAPLQGELIGPTIGAITLLFLVLVSDKIMVFATNPRRIGEKEKLMDYVKNLSFRLGLENVSVYFTSKFPHNVYVVDNFFSRPKIIIGEGLASYLSNSELQALIYYALWRVRSKEARFRTISNFILTFTFLPILVFEKDNEPKGFFQTLRFLFLSPLFLAKVILYRREKDLIEEDHKFLQDSKLRVPFASAIFKIGQLERFKVDQKTPLSFYFFENLALADHLGEELFQDFFDWGYGPDERYKNIVKEN